MEINVVNKQLHFEKVSLKTPSGHHYLQIAAEIDHSIIPFYLSSSTKKKKLISKAKKWCKKLEQESSVVSAVVFKAVLIPPGKGKILKERKNKVQVANYDFAVLIEATSKEKIDEILDSNDYAKQLNAVKEISKITHVVVASNVKKIDAVNHQKQGIFLFNYFYGDDLEQTLGIWEYTAGWFQQETKLDNSTVLLPDEPGQSKYTIINHCRWDKMSNILPSLIFKKSFHSYVLDNFYANNVAAMPVLYKMA